MEPELEGTESAGTLDGGYEAETTGPESDSSGYNPAWEPIKEKLGDAHFQLIQDELKGWDSGVNKRFESINSEFAPYKDLGSPEELANYKNLANQLDENPEAMYEALGNFLRENGRLPSNEEAQGIADDVAESEDSVIDPRIDELARGQEQIRDFLEQQEYMAIQREAETELAQEIEDLESSRGYSKDDMQEIIRRAAFLSADSDKIIPLTVAADEFDSLRERILTTPRPGDSAPRLLPTSGGNPATSQPKSVGALSRNETQDLIAAFLSEANRD